MSVWLGEVKLKSEVESQVEGEGENQQIAPEKKKFSLFGGGGHEFRSLLYFCAHRLKAVLFIKELPISDQ